MQSLVSAICNIWSIYKDYRLHDNLESKCIRDTSCLLTVIDSCSKTSIFSFPSQAKMKYEYKYTRCGWMKKMAGICYWNKPVLSNEGKFSVAQ